MTDQTEIETHDGPAEHEARHYDQTIGCHADGCNLGRSQADSDWESLMAGVYRADKKFVLENSEHRFAAPDQCTFEAVLAAIRPSPDHAIKPIAEGWEEVKDRLTELADRLKFNVEQLSKHWTGTDFDAFEETYTQLRTLILDTVDKITSVHTELDLAGQEIWAQQGGDSGEVPFPEPQYYLDNSGCGDAKVHFRPPWHSGDCEIMGDTEAATWYGGWSGDGGTGGGGDAWYDKLYTPPSEWRAGRAEYLVSQGYDRDQAEQIASDELDDWAFASREETANALISASQRTADDIATRKVNQETGVNDTVYDSTPGTPPTIATGEELETPPSLTTLTLDSPPSLSSGSFTTGEPLDYNANLGGHDSPPFTTTGSTGTTGTYGTGLNEANPWETTDSQYGGLASGGSLGTGPALGGAPFGSAPGMNGGPGGGSLGSAGGAMSTMLGGPMAGGPGRGAGAGGRMGGPSGMVGGGAGGRGAGGATGKAAKLNGAGKAGAGGMMGGKGIGDGLDEEEQEASSWLIEDEDVWGASPKDEDADPYS